MSCGGSKHDNANAAMISETVENLEKLHGRKLVTTGDGAREFHDIIDEFKQLHGVPVGGGTDEQNQEAQSYARVRLERRLDRLAGLRDEYQLGITSRSVQYFSEDEETVAYEDDDIMGIVVRGYDGAGQAMYYAERLEKVVGADGVPFLSRFDGDSGYFDTESDARIFARTGYEDTTELRNRRYDDRQHMFLDPQVAALTYNTMTDSGFASYLTAIRQQGEDTGGNEATEIWLHASRHRVSEQDMLAIKKSIFTAKRYPRRNDVISDDFARTGRISGFTRKAEGKTAPLPDASYGATPDQVVEDLSTRSDYSTEQRIRKTIDYYADSLDVRDSNGTSIREALWGRLDTARADTREARLAEAIRPLVDTDDAARAIAYDMIVRE